jgi:hypothetical protein
MPANWNSYSKSDTARSPRQDDARILGADEIHQQTAKAMDAHVGVTRQNVARHGHALFQGEERLLAAAVGDADDQLVEHQRRTPHQILMSAREGIKCSRVDCPARHMSPKWSAPVRRVPA